jgi:uncharacterized membrane protein YhaH (DUF805 family)
VAIISAGTDWRHLFLSSGGRLGRGPFALAIGTIFLLFVLADFGLSGLVRAVIAWAVFVVLFFSACCLLAKRLHDRGRSGWSSGRTRKAPPESWRARSCWSPPAISY